MHEAVNIKNIFVWKNSYSCTRTNIPFSSVLMVSSIQLDYRSSSQCKLSDAYIDVNIVTKISKES